MLGPMSTPTTDEIIAIYRREAAREAQEVSSGNMKESTHATVLAATRTHVHYAFRQSPNGIASMMQAWQLTDQAIKDAGLWDGPPSGGLPVVPVISLVPAPEATVEAASPTPAPKTSAPKKVA